MLNLLFLLAVLDKPPPLLMLRPNLPSLPLRSRAFRKSSDVDGRRSFVVDDPTLRSDGSTTAPPVKAVFEPLLLCKF